MRNIQFTKLLAFAQEIDYEASWKNDDGEMCGAIDAFVPVLDEDIDNFLFRATDELGQNILILPICVSTGSMVVHEVEHQGRFRYHVSLHARIASEIGLCVNSRDVSDLLLALLLPMPNTGEVHNLQYLSGGLPKRVRELRQLTAQTDGWPEFGG